MTSYFSYTGRLSKIAFAAIILCSSNLMVYALPVGGAVSTGAAIITKNALVTSIQQSTQNAAINWQSFNLATGEGVRILQPNASSILLNRVVGTQPSQIFGTLSANGKVFLVNPNGILFAPGSSVNTSGLVATTLNLSDVNLSAGRYDFSGSSSAAVINQGSMVSEQGYVALLGAKVANQGEIQAKFGTAALVAGNSISFDVLENGLLNVRVTEGALNALAQNGGLIQADGGKIMLTAQSANDLMQGVVNTTGVLQAHTLENRNGSISLTAIGPNGTVSAGGTIDVTGISSGQSGGRIELLGQQVGVIDAKILASGDVAGGQVQVGGKFLDANLQSTMTRAAYISAASNIQADSIKLGDGGKVIILASDVIRAHGLISAHGGMEGGNGGQIETSAEHLNINGLRVDAKAAIGQMGTWLIDPADITISSATTANDVLSANVYAPVSGASVANINVGELAVSLNAANVTVNTTNTSASGTGLGNITISDALTWTANTKLSLNADHDVSVNAAITSTNGSLAVNAGNDINVKSAITTTTGSLEFTAVKDVNLSAPITITTGNLSAIAGGNVNLSAASTITGGNMLLRADNDGTGPGVLGGTVSITCAINCITLTNGVLTIRFNPASDSTVISEVSNYDTRLTGSNHSLDAKAWLFANGVDKVYDGNTSASLALVGGPSGATLKPGTANFAAPNVATHQSISFSDYVVTGTSTNYLLWSPLGVVTGSGSTFANITGLPVVIEVKTLVITPNSVDKTYGQTISLTGFTVVGLLNGDTVTSVNETSLGSVATASVAGGPYAIVGSGAAGNFVPGSYSITYVNGTLSVLPAALSVTANSFNKVYGQTAVLPMTGFTSSGLKNGDTIASVVRTSSGTVASAQVASSPYAVVPSEASGNFVPSNYSISYENSSLTITPAPLTITANDAVKTFGQSLTFPTTAFVAEGLLNGDTVSSVTEVSLGQLLTASSGSSYPIVVSQPIGADFVASNYRIAFVNGALTVVPLSVAPPVVVPPVVDPIVVVPPVVDPTVVVPPVVDPTVVVPPVVDPTEVVPSVVDPTVEVPTIKVPRTILTNLVLIKPTELLSLSPVVAVDPIKPVASIKPIAPLVLEKTQIEPVLTEELRLPSQPVAQPLVVYPPKQDRN